MIVFSEEILNGESRKSRGKYNQYTSESLKKALEEIKCKSLTAYGAEKKYKISQSTLNRHVQGKLKNIARGKSQVLSEDSETRLAEWVFLSAQSGCPKTALEICKAATGLATLEASTGFKGGSPTRGWLQSFKTRCPKVALRTPESIGRASAGVDASKLKGFFNLVERQLEVEKLEHVKFIPASWWSVDETSFVMNPKPKKVYAKKGSKTVHNIERGKPKENITCTYAVGGDGSFVEPFITFRDSFQGLVAVAQAAGCKL